MTDPGRDDIASQQSRRTTKNVRALDSLQRFERHAARSRRDRLAPALRWCIMAERPHVGRRRSAAWRAYPDHRREPVPVPRLIADVLRRYQGAPQLVHRFWSACAYADGERAERTFSTAELADEFSISRNHLTKTLRRLARAGVVTTRRGGGGGTVLAGPAGEIRLSELVRPLESRQALVECFVPGTSACKIDGRCRLKGRLRAAEEAFLAELSQSTLADICALAARARTAADQLTHRVFDAAPFVRGLAGSRGCAHFPAQWAGPFSPLRLLVAIDAADKDTVVQRG